MKNKRPTFRNRVKGKKNYLIVIRNRKCKIKKILNLIED